jgi:serine protease inhibitor
MLMRIRIVLGGLAVLAMQAIACGGPTDPSPPQEITELPRPLTAVEQHIIHRSNAFGFGLLKQVDQRREADKPNTILSPLSASMALGMALEGADGATDTEMRDALGFQGFSREEVNDSYEGLLDILLDLDPAVEVGIANSAWSRQEFPFLPSYFDAITTHFDAEVRSLDFSNPTSKDVMNQWVRDKTNNRIESIVEEVRPLDILFLINTVYFNGKWTTQFKKSETRQAPFSLEDGSQVDVPMLSGRLPKVGFAWLEGGRVMAELPYGGRAFRMVLLVPGAGETVDDLLAELDDDTWRAWLGSLHEQSGEILVQMPKFELEWGGLLNDALQALGMERAFDPYQADFSRMTPATDAHISRVNQKTYMRVDEEGTEAAAATSVGMGVTSAPPAVVVDRPYLLAIRENLSGTILFLGAVRDPR